MSTVIRFLMTAEITALVASPAVCRGIYSTGHLEDEEEVGM